MYRKKGQADKVFTFTHLADAFIQSNLQCNQVILFFFISMFVPWELNPQPFALLTQCSTTEHWDNFLSLIIKQLIKQTAVSWDPDNSIDYNIS